jgi:hypothetical protein
MEASRASWKYALALVAAAVLAAVAYPLSARLAGMQDADGILTAYMSTQELTWYFWRQDRFLNLLPALAWPIGDVAWNLRAQIFLRAFFAFLAPLGVLYMLRPSARFLLLATVVASALLTLLLSPFADFNLYVHHIPVGASMVLFAVSAMAFHRRDRGSLWFAAALAIAFLAYATNIALLLLSFPLLAIAFVLTVMPRRDAAAFAALNAFAVVLAFAHAHRFGEAQTSFGGGEISWHAIHSGYATVVANLHRRVSSSLPSPPSSPVFLRAARRDRGSLARAVLHRRHRRAVVLAMGADQCVLDSLLPDVRGRHRGVHCLRSRCRVRTRVAAGMATRCACRAVARLGLGRRTGRGVRSARTRRNHVAHIGAGLGACRGRASRASRCRGLLGRVADGAGS